MWIRALLWLPLLFENVLADDYFSIGAHLSADALSRALRGTVNDLLQIPRAQNNITIPVFQKVDLKPQAFLDELAEQLDERFLDIKQQLANIAKKVTVKSKKDGNSCGQLVNSFLFPTSASNCCPTVEGEADFEVDRNATTLLLRNPAVQSLFIYNSHQLSECPPRRSSTDRAQHWRQILSGLHQGVQRDVVIAIDMNDLHTDAELQQVKTTAKALLDVALAGDRYSIVANSNNGLETHCSSSISHLQEIVKNLRIPEEGKVRSSHPELMKAATDIWREDNNTKHIIHYISRGILSEMSEAMKTLEVLAVRYLDLPYPFRVNTFAIGEANGAQLLWPKEFLRSVAELDFGRYKQSMREEVQNRLNGSQGNSGRGELTVLSVKNPNDWPLQYIAKLLDFNDPIPQESLQSSIEGQKITIYERAADALIGAVVDGIILFDQPISHNLVLYANAAAELHVYLLTEEGKVVASSRKSEIDTLKLNELDLWTSPDGTLPFKVPHAKHGVFTMPTPSGKRRYLWKTLKRGLIFAVGYIEGKLPAHVHVQELQERQTEKLEHLVYNRFDLQRELHHQCGFHGALSVKGKASLFLPSSAFEPLTRRLDPTEQLVNNYWVYINDRIGVIRSSAIKSGVREEAGMMGAIAKLWIEAEYDPVVIRRFVASRRGLLVSYPAVVLDESHGPRTQRWFQKALENPKRLAITGPIADPLLGDTVVLSTALSYGQQDMFVVGVEVTLNFLEHVMQRTVSACSEGRRCLLLTSIGNVVALPTELLHTLSVDAVERYHLAHVDPTLTSHLLSAPHIFRKEECRSTSGHTHHRFRFNTSYSRVDTKMCSSLPPLSRPQVQSEVVLVPHTDVFLALINTSCVRRKEAGHFCPCSVSDRRCLFCARFDENECECPCQCGPNRASACDAGPKDVHKTTTLCTPDAVPYPPNYAKAPHYLEECQPISCPQFHSPSSCNLRPGCTWCQQDPKGMHLTQPSCRPTTLCYRGMLGRSVLNTNGLDASRDAQNTPSTPVSLIGALVGSVIIGLAIAIFTCYRNRSNRLRERRICNSDQGGTLFCGRFGTLEPNEDFYFDHEGLSREKLILASFERSGGGPPSPRPAPRGPPTVSDLGYSTMTERTNEGSDAGTSSNLPGIRIRVTDGPAGQPFTRLSRLPESPLKCVPLDPHGISLSSSSSVVTTEADIHPPPPPLVAHLID